MGNLLEKEYAELTYDEAKDILQENLQNIRMSFIAVGYYLKYIRDNEFYKGDGYKSVWDFAKDNYGIQMSTASRWMAMNDKFSEDGNSPFLAEKYRKYGKSQLQEMLYLEDDQMEQIKPNMTVKEIRKARKPNKQESIATSQKFPVDDSSTVYEQISGQMSVSDFPEILPDSMKKEKVSLMGYPLRTYAEDSLIAVPGCGRMDCNSCHRDGCNLRQEDCWCVEAPCGNPFPCTTLEIARNLREEIGEKCQFVNEDLAYHRAGDGQPVPCCKDCEDPCEFVCDRAIRSRAVSNPENDLEPKNENIIDSEYKEMTEECCESVATDMEVLREMLEKEKYELEEWIKVDKVDALPQVVLQKKKITVAALANMLCDLEDYECREEQEQFEQPELPTLKNNDQRKKWLGEYKNWGLWYWDENIDVNYYKYDFSDGSRLVVAEYPKRDGYFDKKPRDEHYYHFLEKNKKRYGSCDEVYDEKFRNRPDSETYLIEWLKNLQKGKNGNVS